MSIIELKNITKSFGALRANDSITLKVEENTVHCLLGENGAGKSTLMKILFGVYKPEFGEIAINGKNIVFNSPLDAINHGIGMLYQHFMLIEDFTVLENIILGKEITKNGKILFDEAAAKINLLIAKYKLNLDIHSKAGDLNISQQQQIELLKILYRDSQILIFDEPTAVLSPVEVNEFYKIVEYLKSEGKTIILITHKLNEVMESADEVTVLRKGKTVYNTKTAEMNITELGKQIIGDIKIDTQSENYFIKKNDKKAGETLIKLLNISLQKGNRNLLNEINLEIKRGKIYGICGVEGNGQNEIIDLLFGLEKKFTGEFIKNTKKISLVPDDRLKKGMIKEFSSAENMILKKPSNRFITNSKLNKIDKEFIEAYDIKIPSNDNRMINMSGGNQQKAIVAREIELNNDVILFSHPTRGVDIKSADYIHRRILSEKISGKGILVISADIEELFFLSDELYVIFKGKLIKKFKLEEIGQRIESNKNKFIEDIGKLMIGIKD